MRPDWNHLQAPRYIWQGRLGIEPTTSGFRGREDRQPLPCGVEPHGLGNRTPAQVLWSGTVPDGIAPLRLSHTDIRPDTSEQCSFQRGYGDASEARTRTLQRERLMTLPIRLWHRRKEIWLGKRLLLPCRHGMDTAPVGSHHYILLSLSLVAVPAGLEPATP